MKPQYVGDKDKNPKSSESAALPLRKVAGQNNNDFSWATMMSFYQHHSLPWEMTFSPESNSQLTKSRVGIKKRFFSDSHKDSKHLPSPKVAGEYALTSKTEANVTAVIPACQQLILPSSFLQEVLSSLRTAAQGPGAGLRWLDPHPAEVEGACLV